MRFNNVLSNRPAYLDRNPLDIRQNFTSVAAPHITTVRWTYTVPTARKAIVQNIYHYMNISVVATARALTSTSYQLAPGGVGSGADGYIEWQSTNVVDSRQSFQVNSGICLLASDIISGRTADGSTGGQVDYVAAFAATEFDA